MKKNLRIVSAAAAALLAVAPVAAAAVVSPATTSVAHAATDINTKLPKIGNGNLGTVTISSDTILKDGANKALTDALHNAGLLSTAFDVVDATPNSNGTYTFKLITNSNWSSLTDAAKTAILNGRPNVTTGETVKYNGASATTPAWKESEWNAKVVAPAKDSASKDIKAGESSSSIFPTNANTAVNISAVARTKTGIPSAINGNIIYTDAKGAQYTALLHGDTNTVIYTVDSKDGAQVMHQVPATELKSNKLYYAHFNHVTMNLGTNNSGKSVTFTLPMGSSFAGNVAGAKYKDYYKSIDGTKVPRTMTVNADANGVADLGTIVSRFYAYDATNLQEVHFYAQKTGNQVSNGSLDLHAVNKDGKQELNVESLFAAMSQEYVASQLVHGTHSINKIDTLVPQNDLRDQLKKQNITVDANGYFVAPKSFTLNLNAKSKINGATATLPVTINVDNAAASTTPANETTKNVTIMHISTIYDKNGVATHEPALRAYNSVSVVSDPVTINGAKFYKLAGKDQYIKVGNVDGTSRTLKHNAYVYKSNGKARMASKKHHVVRKSGASVTTYGKSFMIAGHQMYRVGRNQYIKVANFR